MKNFSDIKIERPLIQRPPGLFKLFVLDTVKALLNVYQLGFVFFEPDFSLSYTVSLPFLIFCCQNVARGIITPRSFQMSCLYCL